METGRTNITSMETRLTDVTNMQRRQTDITGMKENKTYRYNMHGNKTNRFLKKHANKTNSYEVLQPWCSQQVQSVPIPHAAKLPLKHVMMSGH